MSYAPIADAEAGKGQAREEHGSASSQSWLLGAVVVVGVSLSAVGLAVSTTRSGQSLFSHTSGLSSSRGSDGPVSWTLARSGYDALPYFTESNPSLTYEMLKSYDAVVEPNVEMELYLLSDYSVDADYFYRWSVCDSDGTTGCRDGKMYTDGTQVLHETINVPCGAGEELVVKITKHTTADDEQTGALKGTALCSYVRRELRALTSDDLAATMDAMAVLYSTEEKKGIKAYGENFHNSTYYLQAHHFNAAWRDGDHIHEGLGFLAQHIKITNMFEEAMQAVDPAVSMPYWDFTIDVADGNIYPQDTFAFTPETFGSITPAKDAAWGYTYRNDTIKGGRIPDGRFKHLAADMNYKFANFEQISANYGYLRAPWNANPSPWVSRFSGYTTTLPSCTDHYNWLKDASFTDFMSDSPYAPHASVHGAIGSVFGCDLMDPLREQGLLVSEYQQNKFCQKWSFLIKELYRKNFLTGSDNGACSYSKLDQDGQHCTYVCNTADSKYDNMGLQLENLIATTYTGSVLTNTQYNVFREFICEGDGAKIFAGDHTESASPADPSFWPIHPTLERLTQAKYISGSFDDTVWPSDSVGDYVCDKSQCYEDDSYDYYAACCYGHYEHDQLLDFVTPDKNSGTGPTNRETMDGLDPSNPEYSMPYIYDSFDWSHCTEDFDALLASLASSAKATGTTGTTGTMGSKKGSDSWLLVGDDTTSRALKGGKKSGKKSSKKSSRKSGRKSGTAYTLKDDDGSDNAPRDIDDPGVEVGGDDAKPNDDVPSIADDENAPAGGDDAPHGPPADGDDEDDDAAAEGDDDDHHAPPSDDKSGPPSPVEDGDDAEEVATDDKKANKKTVPAVTVVKR